MKTWCSRYHLFLIMHINAWFIIKAAFPSHRSAVSKPLVSWQWTLCTPIWSLCWYSGKRAIKLIQLIMIVSCIHYPLLKIQITENLVAWNNTYSLIIAPSLQVTDLTWLSRSLLGVHIAGVLAIFSLKTVERTTSITVVPPCGGQPETLHISSSRSKPQEETARHISSLTWCHRRRVLWRNFGNKWILCF